MSTALTEKKLDIGAVLGSAKKTDKKASSVTSMSVDAKTKEIAQEYAHYKKLADDAKTALELAQSQLLSLVEPLRVALIRQFGHSNSFKISIGDKDLIMSWKHAYSKIPMEAEELLREQVGPQYDHYFTEGMEIKVKDEALTDAELTVLIESVGADQFARFFEVSRGIKPLPRYTEDSVTFPDERKQALAQIVRQYKPAFKVK